MYKHVVTKGTQLPMIPQHVDQIQEVKQYISKSLDIQSWQQCGQVAIHSTVITFIKMYSSELNNQYSQTG